MVAWSRGHVVAWSRDRICYGYNVQQCYYLVGRVSGEDKEIPPADVVLFEGILTFYWPELRDEYDMMLFVDTDADTRLARRGLSDTSPPDIPSSDIPSSDTSPSDTSPPDTPTSDMSAAICSDERYP